MEMEKDKGLLVGGLEALGDGQTKSRQTQDKIIKPKFGGQPN